MEKLIHDDPDVVKIALEQEIARSPESRYDHRLHGLLFLWRGLSSYEVENLLGHSPRTIQYWFHCFQEKGLAGLVDGKRKGRRSSLRSIQRKQLEAHLRKPSTTLGYTQGQWDGVLLSHHLNREFGLVIEVRQCQRLFHHLGFRRQKLRGVIAGADSEAQDTYKKPSSVRPKK